MYYNTIKIYKERAIKQLPGQYKKKKKDTSQEGLVSKYQKSS